ncbi:hypothetical protein [Burkholderia cepacia]|uniref:hypothetical protein n=1 Tax=Burkholderia cepacia TaxID=292 RepID=UPI0012D9F29C|nr:hypothetical protein [Burkholderia cepacia]
MNLEKFRKARLWIDELPDATYIPLGVVAHSVSVKIGDAHRFRLARSKYLFRLVLDQCMG